MSYRIPLIKPYINDRVKELVSEVLDSGFLTEGPVTRRFEELWLPIPGCPMPLHLLPALPDLKRLCGLPVLVRVMR